MAAATGSKIRWIDLKPASSPASLVAFVFSGFELAGTVITISSTFSSVST